MKSSFFHSILIMVMIGLHNAACKNSIDTPPVTYTKLEVQEYKTNFPIAGAEVKIYECTKQGFGGCAELSLRRTVTADTAFVMESLAIGTTSPIGILLTRLEMRTALKPGTTPHLLYQSVRYGICRNKLLKKPK